MNDKKCYCCGESKGYVTITPVDAELQRTWGISKSLAHVFNMREGIICRNCGVNIRAQGLAKAILNSRYGYGKTYLKEWVIVANKNNIKVCELNSCHELHHVLKNLKNFTYAEYGTKTEQNIEALTYKTDSFDLFLHSETLEHVNNPRKAMDESRRVIKEEGLILFTTPLIWARKTSRRAEISNNTIRYIKEPSYHGKQTDDYLVFFEYGRNIDKLLGVSLSYIDWRHQNYVFDSGKRPSRIDTVTKLRLIILEKIAQTRKADI